MTVVDRRALARPSISGERRAAALAGLAVSAAERLGAPPGLPVVLSGGLFRHAELETTVRIAIEEARPGSDIRTLARQAVTGAVRLAMVKARAPYRA